MELTSDLSNLFAHEAMIVLYFGVVWPFEIMKVTARYLQAFTFDKSGMSERNAWNTQNRAIFGIGLVTCVYMVFKAATTSFTHDESVSFNVFNDWSFIDIISFRQGFTNLHILNSLGMKYFSKAFGPSELALRLPNLLALVVFMRYGYLLLKEVGTLLAISVFVLLLSNDILLDLFGIARGYGLSFAFMFMALYHVIRSFEGQRNRHLILFHLAGLLAILSNFVQLDVYLSLLLIQNLLVFVQVKWITKTGYQVFASIKIHIIPILVIVGMLFEPMRRFFKYSHLDFGGKSGFFEDTVTHLVTTVLHEASLASWALIAAIATATLIVVAGTLVIVANLMREPKTFFEEHKGLIINNLLLWSLSAAMVSQHILLHADYPVARFSTFVFPLFVLHFGLLMHYLHRQGWPFAPHLAAGLALASSIAFVVHLEPRACSEWKPDMYTETMLENLTQEHERRGQGQPIKLGINWFFEPTINFYRQTHHLDWLLPVDRSGLHADDDYVYTYRTELETVDPTQYEVIVEFGEISTVLVRNVGEE